MISPRDKQHGLMEKIVSAKTVFFHRNGVNRAPKTIVVNPRQTRTLDSLLDKVTATLKTPGAVRNIRTPTGRHRISKLDQLESERAYVAVGTEGFKRIDYSSVNEIGSGRHVPHKELEVIEPVKHNPRIVVSGRARRIGETEPLGNKTIYVYANGDTLSSAKAILLKKNDLKSLDKVLKEVNGRVELQTGAVRWLYVLKSGQLVKDSSELENKEEYVAVGSEKRLKKGNYASQGATQVTPRRVSVKVRNPPVKKGHQSHKKAKPHQKRSYSEKVNATLGQFESEATRDSIKRESTKGSPSFMERVADKINDAADGDENVAREATKGSIKRESTKDSPSFMDRVADKFDDAINGDEQVSREATKTSIKRESTKDSPSFMDRVADKFDDVINGDEQMSREATKTSIKRESTKGSPSFMERVADKVGDVLDGDDSSENGERSGSRGADNQTDEESDVGKKVYNASGEQEVKGDEIREDKHTVEDKPIDMLPPEEVTEEQIEDEDNAQ